MIEDQLHSGKAFAYNGETNRMKNYSLFFFIALAITTTLTSCDLVQGVFKAGFYAAIIVIVIVVLLVIWLLKRFRR